VSGHVELLGLCAARPGKSNHHTREPAKTLTFAGTHDCNF
jgi:hypothetical protein